MIFSMLVVGIGYSLVNILQMTRDSQNRETAISLASSELDAIRAIGDPFKVLDVPSRTQVVGGNTYTISRTAGWATPDGSVDTCGSGGGPLQYKSVSVTVSWVGMRVGASSVHSDTALVPTTRINDPTKGTILVSVKNEAGLGSAGITFTAISGGTSIDTTPTNADGCSFLLGVPPGDYTVKLTSSNRMSIGQLANPTINGTVAAGSSAQFSFQYDQRGTYLMNYASNDYDAVRPLIPTDLTTTFFNSNGRYTTAVPTSSLQGSAYLYPASSGYEVVAGSFVPSTESGPSCESVDPGSWPEDTSVSPSTIGTRAPTAFAEPGGVAASTPVPMGIATVRGSLTKGYLFAESQSAVPLPGQPACDISTTYSFGRVFSILTLTPVKIALPFGTWKLYESSTLSGYRSSIDSSRITLESPGVIAGTDGTFALDPRGVTP